MENRDAKLIEKTLSLKGERKGYNVSHSCEGIRPRCWRWPTGRSMGQEMADQTPQP